jgi:hypothetical protein
VNGKEPAVKPTDAMQALDHRSREVLAFVLDDPDYSPELVAQAFDHYGQPVTVADIETHRSGR